MKTGPPQGKKTQLPFFTASLNSHYETKQSFFSGCTVAQNNQEHRLKYWATRSSIRLFTRTTHLFACYILLASLARSVALIPLLACSFTHSRVCGKMNYRILPNKHFLSFYDYQLQNIKRKIEILKEFNAK